MPCTSQDLASKNTPADLFAYLQTEDWTCLQYLWTYDANVRAAYSTTNMNYVLNQIAALAPNYQGTDAQHMRELMFFVRVGFYQKFFHANDPGLFDSAAVSAAATAAFQAFGANPHYNDFTTEAAQITYEWINAVDAAGLWDGSYGPLTSIISTFLNDPARQPDYDQQLDVYSVFRDYDRAVFEPSFAALVDANLVSLLQQFAVNTNPPAGGAYLVSNAIYLLGLVGLHVAAQKAAVIQALNAAVAAQPQLSVPWLWAVDALCNLGACPVVNGQTITHDVAAAQLEAQLFPNSYVFDDGAIVVKTAVALDKIQVLYHGCKQVAAQFNRVTETIAPLEGDPNGILTMQIYASPQDYQNYQGWLTGLPTNNGGLYYEQLGVFYTYDRTPQQDSYTLEELTRHEYSHYLIERFVTAGLWGQAPLYQDGQGNPSNRMVWFDEGFAEFLTGSTDINGVQPRKHLASMIAGDGPNGRLSLSQVFAAAYGSGFTFYRYSAFFFQYMYEKRRDLLRQFIDYVRSAGTTNDPATVAAITGFDMLTAQLGNDPQLEADYQSFLDGIVATAGNLNDPATTVPPLNALDSNDVAQIQTSVRKTRIGYLATASVSAQQSDARFTCRGTLSGQVVNTQDVDAAWTLFNANLDELLNAVRTQPLNNFQYTVARFGDIRFQPEGNLSYPMADYYLEGPLGPVNIALPPDDVRVKADLGSTRFGGGAVCKKVGNTVTCTLSMETQAFPQGTPNSVLTQELTDGLEELRDQVYAINPPYYRNLSCDFSGPAQQLTTQGNQIYQLRPVQVTVSW
ncbi:MAG TPA: collagenase [Alphaproteobacteria bacterium]|nr:collagenase [Alphaproteobacteria bacterium]